MATRRENSWILALLAVGLVPLWQASCVPSETASAPARETGGSSATAGTSGTAGDNGTAGTTGSGGTHRATAVRTGSGPDRLHPAGTGGTHRRPAVRLAPPAAAPGTGGRPAPAAAAGTGGSGPGTGGSTAGRAAAGTAGRGGTTAPRARRRQRRTRRHDRHARGTTGTRRHHRHRRRRGRRMPGWNHGGVRLRKAADDGLHGLLDVRQRRDGLPAANGHAHVGADLRVRRPGRPELDARQRRRLVVLRQRGEHSTASRPTSGCRSASSRSRASRRPRCRR